MNPIPIAVSSALLVTLLSSQQALPRQQELGATRMTVSAPNTNTYPLAATASYVHFGDSCGTSCAALNDNRAQLRTGALLNEYAFGHQFTQTAVIVGFQLYTSTVSVSGPSVSMTCSVFRESTILPGQPEVTPAATGTMTVGRAVDFYGVQMNAPVNVQANEKIWIHQSDATNVNAAGLASAGTTPAVPTFFRRVNVAWASSATVAWPAWRILCANNTAMFCSGLPKLGTSIQLTMQGGPPTAPAALFFGASNPNLATPYCTKLYAAADVPIALMTNTSGGASFTLAIPNLASLDGVMFWNQMWAILAPNVIGTNGGFAILGQ